jgi:hypothetical protein
MLQTVNVPISFAGGLDTKTDEKLVVPGKLTLLENGVFTKGGQIQKRNGYEALGASILGRTTSLTTGQALQTYDQELLTISENHVYSRSTSNDALVDKGSAFSVIVENDTIVRNAYQQSRVDSARVGNVAVYAWQDSRGGVRATVIDTETGSQFQSDVQLNASATDPRCCVINQFIYVFYADGANLRARKLDPQAPTSFATAVLIGNDLISGTPYYDVVPHGLKAVVAYHVTNAIKLKYILQDGSVGTTTVGLPNAVSIAENPSNSLTLWVEPTTFNIFVAWQNAVNGIRYAVRAPDFTQVLAPTTINAAAVTVNRLTGVCTSTTQARVFFEVNSTNPYDHNIGAATVATNGTVGSTTVIKRSVGLASKAFFYNDEVYLNVVFDSTLQANYFTLNTDGTIVAKLLPGQAGGLVGGNNLPQVVAVSEASFSFAGQVKTKFVSEGNTSYTLKGVTNLSLDFSHARAFASAQLGENLHFVGGFLSMYDGQSVVEHGFHLFPENVSANPSTTGGSVADGNYTYYVVYEWFDNKGQRHQSAPSVGLSSSVSGGGGSGKITLTIPTLRLTAKTSPRSEVSLTVYRTKASGTIPFRLTSLSSPTFNDPAQDFITYVDTVNDSSIGSNEILYTTGGILENIAAPACSIIETYKNRLALAGLETENTVWYSRTQTDGEGVAFNDSQFIKVDPLGGDVTALKFMDDKLLIFKASNIFVLVGDGPNDAGTQNNFSVPELVTSDVGCTNPNSVVLMPDGVMFQSSKGIYLVNRSLQVGYIGADVEGYNSQTITSADLIEDRNQVRFLTDDGSTLLYDYYFKQWSTFTNHEGLDAVIWQGDYCYLRSTGQVYLENDAHFQDVNQEFRLRIGTAWIKTAGIQGFQRVRKAAVLGNYKSSHVLRMRIGYDYEPTYSGRVLFNAGNVINTNYYGQDSYFGESTPYGGVDTNVYQFRAQLPRQKCEAIRFLFEDVTSGTPGESYSLSDLTLEVGLKPGLMRLKAGKTVG